MVLAVSAIHLPSDATLLSPEDLNMWSGAEPVTLASATRFLNDKV